jgi:uncharacterized protein YxjI
MPVLVSCECGTSYDLKDEFAGKLVKCPNCGRPARAPSAAVATAAGDPAFDRDTFLLRQQLLKISEKYDVGDEQGNKIIFVERPAHLLRNLGAALALFVILIGGVSVMSAVTPARGASTAAAWIALFGMLITVVAAVAAAIAISAKRHVTFYRDESKRERLLDILQDKKFQPIMTTYTVRDARGRPLARLGKNLLFNFIRKRWYVWAPGPDRRLLFLAKEDSVILSLLRRFLGPLFGLLRTNFIFLPAGSEDVIGEFKRKFTILDRYVLDMTADPERLMDRRIALALGVMLDTGERR